MRRDPIVEKVRKAREEIFAECDYDLQKYGERLRVLEIQYKDRMVKPKTSKSKRKPVRRRAA